MGKNKHWSVPKVADVMSIMQLVPVCSLEDEIRKVI